MVALVAFMLHFVVLIGAATTPRVRVDAAGIVPVITFSTSIIVAL